MQIKEQTIRQDHQGRLCMNDLHHAFGGESRHKPSHWLALVSTRKLLESLPGQHEPKFGTEQGRRVTFISREMSLRYAKWVSALSHTALSYAISFQAPEQPKTERTVFERLACNTDTRANRISSARFAELFDTPHTQLSMMISAARESLVQLDEMVYDDEACLLSETQALFMSSFFTQVASRGRKALVKYFSNTRDAQEQTKIEPRNVQEALAIIEQMSAYIATQVCSPQKASTSPPQKGFSPRPELKPIADGKMVASLEVDGLYGLKEAALILGQNPNRFCQWLRENGWLYYNAAHENQAFQDKIDRGYLVHVPVAFFDGKNRKRQKLKVNVTQKGLIALERLIKETV